MQPNHQDGMGCNEISFRKIQQCPLKNMLKKCADCWCFETIKKIPELAIWHFKENFYVDSFITLPKTKVVQSQRPDIAQLWMKDSARRRPAPTKWPRHQLSSALPATPGTCSFSDESGELDNLAVRVS